MQTFAATWRAAGRRLSSLAAPPTRRRASAALAHVLAAPALAAAVLALPGCTTTRPQKLPDGAAGLMVDCSGASLTWTHCFREAGEKCPHGYNIVKRDTKGGGKLVSGDFLQVFGNQAEHRKLLIRCTGGDAARASADAAGTPPPSVLL